MYEERVVLFLDILGFKTLIKDNKEQKIYNALGTFAAFAKSPPSFPYSTHTTAFSDSIVVSYKLESAGLKNVINTASMLAWGFLQQGILTRGGIACGKMHHTQDRLFGPAMIDAHEIESKLAVYPRVLVSDEIRAMISEQPNTIPICDPGVLRQDFDGEWYINLMSHLVLSPFITITDKKKLFDAKVQTVNQAIDNPSPPCEKIKKLT